MIETEFCGKNPPYDRTYKVKILKELSATWSILVINEGFC